MLRRFAGDDDPVPFRPVTGTHRSNGDSNDDQDSTAVPGALSRVAGYGFPSTLIEE
jgi:hypothetical protein